QKQYEPVFREMWRMIFGDPIPYEDFYFKNVYPKNQVLAYEKDHEIAGMIHLNPYQVYVNGHFLPLHYIVGVATLEKYRRQGIMRKMLIKCMQDMSERGEIFTYLMPADIQYYEPFDFAVIQSFRTKKECGAAGVSGLSVLKEEDYDAASDFVNNYCSHVFRLFTKFDREYLIQLHEEVLCENGEILVWKEEDVIRGFCCYDQDQDAVYIRQLFCEKSNDMIREIGIYFSGKPVEVILDGGEDGNGALIMARILRLDRLMEMMRGKAERKFYIHISDSILEHQNGNFRIMITPEKCRIQRTSVIPEQSISIWDLTKILFGFACQDLLEEYPDFKWIEPLSPVMIGEII
ncbi:MAG: GNAT family N-acetyltransferase, partial [Lachnospiraceae bacterium]|nr:GNAT family N-acetyltransferase [Lachnospiraceae bacterium]